MYMYTGSFLTQSTKLRNPEDLCNKFEKSLEGTSRAGWNGHHYDLMAWKKFVATSESDAETDEDSQSRLPI